MLRALSTRPVLLADLEGGRVGIGTTRVGQPAPLGRERVVSALKLNNNPPQPIIPPQLVADRGEWLIADPTDGSIVGMPGLWINRLVQATRTRDTRRL